MFFSLKHNSNIDVIKQSLTKKIYKRISRLHYSYVNEINSIFDCNLSISNEDKITLSLYDLKKQSYYKLDDYIYDVEHEPFNIFVYDDYIKCYMIDPICLSSKISNYTNRYYPIEITLQYSKTESHSVVFIFDTASKISFVIDSNSSLEFCELVYNNKKISYYLHNIYRHYSRGVGYRYIRHNYTLNVNYKINSNLQQHFFDGYCRAWSFYFIYLCSTKDDINIINIIRYIQTSNIELVNNFIEKFQVYYYNKYVKFVV